VRLLIIRHGQTPCNVSGELDTAYPGGGLHFPRRSALAYGSEDQDRGTGAILGARRLNRH
jgi:hypothetical protein